MGVDTLAIIITTAARFRIRSCVPGHVTGSVQKPKAHTSPSASTLIRLCTVVYRRRDAVGSMCRKFQPTLLNSLSERLYSLFGIDSVLCVMNCVIVR
jgi:hypothetical protein